MSRRLSVCATLYDGFLRSQSEKLGALLVAFSMADLVALRLVGIPATMACGLQQLTGDYLVDFCRSFGLGTAGTKACTEQDSMSRAESRPTGIVATGSAATSMDQEPDRVATNPPRSLSLRLVIVNWVPSELRREEPAQQQKVRSHLRDLEKHLQLPLDEVFVWTPTIEDVERVKFCLANSGREQVRAAILDSLDGGLVQATDTEDQFTLPNDLPGIWTALRETSLHGSRNLRLEKQLWDEYERMIYGELVEPLVRQAQQEPDPENRARLLGIAVINRLLHPTAELYSANLTRQVRKTGIRKARLVDGRELVTSVQRRRAMEDVQKLEQVETADPLPERNAALGTSEQKCQDRREQRIEEYLRDSLEQGDAFQATLRAATADLMDIGYRLATGIKTAIREELTETDQYEDLAPALSNLLLVDRQITRFAQLDRQWAAASETPKKRRKVDRSRHSD